MSDETKGALRGIQPPKQKYFLLKTAGGVCALAHQDILYVEYYDHRLTCYLTNGETVQSLHLRGSFAVLTAELVESGRFLRISASHVIHMLYVKRFNSRLFEMTNGACLNLSRLYADARVRYLAYVKE